MIASINTGSPCGIRSGSTRIWPRCARASTASSGGARSQWGKAGSPGSARAPSCRTSRRNARARGGIASIVRETREASEMELIRSASARLRRLLDEGVTTVEIKSGYGLNVATEMKMLRVARLLGSSAPVTVKTTFLGAQALPPEYQGRAEAYIDLVCEEM